MKSAAKRDRIVRLGAWLILVLALLPNISYMGHWTEMASAPQTTTIRPSQSDTAPTAPGSKRTPPTDMPGPPTAAASR